VGDALARAAGLTPDIFTAYYLDEDGYVVGDSPLVGGDAWGVNLGPAPVGFVPENNSQDVKNSSESGGSIVYGGDISDARIAALNKIITDNAWLANSKQDGQRIRKARQVTQQARAELEVINYARRQKAAQQAAKAAAEAKAKAEAAAQAKAAAEAKAKAEAAAKAKAAAEAKAKAEAAAKAKAAAEAKAKAEATAQAKAAAEAKAKAAAEAEVKAQRQAALSRLRSANVQVARGIPLDTTQFGWSAFTNGAITLGEDIADSVLFRISSVLTELRSIAAASLAGPVAATIVGLLYSEKVGIGSDVVPGRDISALLSTDILSLPDADSLIKAAEEGTPVEMAIRGQLVERDDGILEARLVRTVVPGKVPVAHAVQDTITGYWRYTQPTVTDTPERSILVSPAGVKSVNDPLTPSDFAPIPEVITQPTVVDDQGRIILTSPIDVPGLNDLSAPPRPAPLPEQIIHTGGVTVPQEITVTTTPVANDANFNDLILVFPKESGLKPIYVMLSGLYGETNAKGKYSGRDYNSDKAGGPVQNLDWKSARIDRAGVDQVKRHTGRFGESAANKVMIDRLEKILRGELDASDIDKRFYTHEIRELERYRNLGIKDGDLSPSVEEQKAVWNNAHTATLEDYKINEKFHPLYTDEALQAAYEQDLKDAIGGLK
jgi:hypothetical protein